MLPASLSSLRRAERLSEADGFLLEGGDVGGDDRFTGGGLPELIRAVSLFGARFCFWSNAAGAGFSAELSGFGGKSRATLGARPVGGRFVIGGAGDARIGGASDAADPSTRGPPIADPPTCRSTAEVWSVAEGVRCHSLAATVVTDGCVENDDVGWLRVEDATVTSRSGCRFVDVADGSETGGCRPFAETGGC